MDKLFYYNKSIELLEQIKLLPRKPRLLLHVCCGPCSAWPLMFLNPYFDITIYYNNSNIYPYNQNLIKQNKLTNDFVKPFQSSGTAENGNEVYNEVMDILYNIKNNN